MDMRRVSVISGGSFDDPDAVQPPGTLYIPPDLVQRLEEKRNRKRRVLLEPVIALYFAAWIPSITLTQQYIYWREARDLNLSQTGPDRPPVTQQDCRTLNLTTTQLTILDEVQASVADWLVWLDLSGDIPGLFMILFLGTYADVIGRKFALLLPAMGGLVICLNYLLVALFDLPLWALLVGTVVEALSGGYTGMVGSCLFYLEDTLERGQDPLMFAASDLSYGIILGLAELGMGYLMKATGFIIPLLTLLSLHIANIIYVVVFVPDIQSSQVTEEAEVTCCACSAFSKGRPGRLRKILGVTMVIFLLYSMVYNSKSAIATLYQLNLPYCWDSVNIGLFRGITYSTGQIAQTVFTMFLIKPLKDVGIILISCLSALAQFVWMAFAPDDLSLYMAPLVGCASALGAPLLITKLYHLVPPNEQDEVLADIFVLDIVCSLLGVSIFNPLYGATIGFYKPLVFLLYAAIMLICVILVIYLIGTMWCHRRDMDRAEAETAAEAEAERERHWCRPLSEMDYRVISLRL